MSTSENKDEGEQELPALLWDEMPEDVSNHPDYMAMQALMYDESTSIERAENFKEQGNQRLKVALQSRKKLYFQEAIKYYTQGIAEELQDNPQLKSILFSNRAQAEIHLKNWRKALNDSEAALRWNRENLKACYRGAKAALKLDEISTAVRLCEGGLQIDPQNQELQTAMEEAKERSAVVEAHKQRVEKEQVSLREQAAKLMEAFSERNITLCQSNFEIGKLKPFVDSESVLHWSIQFVYPETAQQDIIEDVAETDLVSELLDLMFSPDAEPLEWDTENKYRRESVDVYYLANAGKPFSNDEMLQVLMGQYQGDPEKHAPPLYGDKSACYVKVEEGRSLHHILSEADCVVPGIPTFFLVARGSNYHERFIQFVSCK